MENQVIKKEKISVFWFSRDLRLFDNSGLFHALNSGYSVLPVFIFDTDILDKLPDKRDRRVSFIFSALQNIQNELVKIGSSLLLLYGNTVELFKKLIEDYSVHQVFVNHDYEPSAMVRDKNIFELLQSKSISFNTFKDQVIFEKSEVMKPDGEPYTIFTPYSRMWKNRLKEYEIRIFESEKFLNHFYKTEPFRFPEIQEIGFIKVATPSSIPFIDEDIIRNYHETRNFPYISGTTNLSTHLRFGTVSIRKLLSTTLNLNEQWLNELIWREFFMMILFHYPHVVNSSFKKKYDFIVWRNNEEEFNKWCEGETGYPIVDAGMRELNKTGLMHNRVRMIVASFLTKHLLIDWRWGESYFAAKLLDYELSSNNGNWQWAAGCGCDAAPYFRIFNPEEQTRKFDPDLVYIKKWVTNLNDLNYASPLVEHRFARERALLAYKKALNVLK